MNLKALVSRKEKRHLIDVTHELERLVDDGAKLGHEDGRRNWPPTTSECPAQAEALLHARAQRLIDVVVTCYRAELDRARRTMHQAVDDYRRLTAQLPETVRKARRVFDSHQTRFEGPLIEVTREAEAAARLRRSAELHAGTVFQSASGGLPMLIATLFVALALEAAMSTVLIADSHPGGYLGALGLAGALACLNLSIAWSAGRGLRALVDRDAMGWRIASAIFGLGVLAGLVAFHGVVAKLRELSLASTFDRAMQQAVIATMEAPPTEFSSLLVGLIGFVCACAAIVAGFKRADATQAAGQASVARDAEAALRAFEAVRGDYAALDDVTAQAIGLIDALDERVFRVRATLAEAVQTTAALQQDGDGLLHQVRRAHAAAVQQYRTRNAIVRGDAVPAAFRIEPETAAADTISAELHGALASARATLIATDYASALEAARVEVDRVAKANANRVAEQLAGIEGVLYRDWFKPADVNPPRLAAPRLVPVDAMRRAEAS